MGGRLWSRRQVVTGCARVGAGLAVGKSAWGFGAQMPRPEALQDERLTFVTTTAANAWQKGGIFKPAFSWTLLNLNVDPEHAPQAGWTAQPMQGFGGCFNERGWTSLMALSEQDRESVMHELFDPAAGARFTYCRMPIGANDYATEAYSYDETDGDFELKHFSIEHDR